MSAEDDCHSHHGSSDSCLVFTAKKEDEANLSEMEGGRQGMIVEGGGVWQWDAPVLKIDICSMLDYMRIQAAKSTFLLVCPSLHFFT